VEHARRRCGRSCLGPGFESPRLHEKVVLRDSAPFDRTAPFRLCMGENDSPSCLVIRVRPWLTHRFLTSSRVRTFPKVSAALRLAMAILLTFFGVLSWACRTSQPGCDGAGAARAIGSWSLAIRVPDSVRAGDSVPLALVLKNIGDSPLDPGLGLPSDADFVVTRAGDTSEVWGNLHARKILMGALRRGAISPGDSIRIEDHWDQRGNDGRPVRPGMYCVRGDLRTRGLDSLRTDAATLRLVLQP